MHVGVEGDVQTVPAKDDRKQEDHPQQPTVALRRHRRDFPESQTLFLSRGTVLHKMGQEHQHEEDGAHQHKGSKKTKVAEGRCIERYQTGESAHGGDITNEQGRHHLLEYLAHRTTMVSVEDEMQGVIDGNTDDDRADTEHDQRHIATHDGHEAHGEEPAKKDGQTNEHQVFHLAEREHEQQQDQRHRDRDGPIAVVLDAGGITDGNDRRTGNGDIHFWQRLHRMLRDAVDLADQHAVIRRFHRAVWRGHHRNGKLLARREDIAVVDLNRHRRLTGLQPVDDR